MLVDFLKGAILSVICTFLYGGECEGENVDQPLFPNIVSCDRTTFGILDDRSVIFALERYSSRSYNLFYAEKVDEKSFSTPILFSQVDTAFSDIVTEDANKVPYPRSAALRGEPVLSNYGDLLIPTGRLSLDLFSFSTNSVKKFEPFREQNLRVVISPNTFEKWIDKSGNMIASRLFRDRAYYVSNIYTGESREIPVPDPNIARIIFDGDGNPVLRFASTSTSMDYRLDHFQDGEWKIVGLVPSTNFLPLNLPKVGQGGSIFRALVYVSGSFRLYDVDVKNADIVEISDATKRIALVQLNLNQNVSYIVYEHYRTGDRSIDFLGDATRAFPFSQLTKSQLMDGVTLLNSDHAIYEENEQLFMIERNGHVYPVCGTASSRE